MLGLLMIFSFWIAITIIMVLPLILTFAIGGYIAEKLGLDGFNYYLFMMVFYAMILIILIII